MNRIIYSIIIVVALLTILTYTMMDIFLIVLCVGLVELKHLVKDSAAHDYLDELFDKRVDHETNH